jgi:hypothetical protein
MDPERFFSAPDQTLKGVLSPDPACIFLLSVNLRLERVARQDRTLFLKL